jgi:hypothetical protein
MLHVVSLEQVKVNNDQFSQACFTEYKTVTVRATRCKANCRQAVNQVIHNVKVIHARANQVTVVKVRANRGQGTFWIRPFSTIRTDTSKQEQNSRKIGQGRASMARLLRKNLPVLTIRYSLWQLDAGNRSFLEIFGVQYSQMATITYGVIHHCKHPAIILCLCVRARAEDGLLGKLVWPGVPDVC